MSSNLNAKHIICPYCYSKNQKCATADEMEAVIETIQANKGVTKCRKCSQDFVVHFEMIITSNCFTMEEWKEKMNEECV